MQGLAENVGAFGTAVAKEQEKLEEKLDGVADQVLDKVKAAFKGNLLKGGGSSAEPEIQEIESPAGGSPLVALGGKRPSRGARRQLCARTPTPTPLRAHGPVRARSSLIMLVLGLTGGVASDVHRGCAVGPTATRHAGGIACRRVTVRGRF